RSAAAGECGAWPPGGRPLAAGQGQARTARTGVPVAAPYRTAQRSAATDPSEPSTPTTAGGRASPSFAMPAASLTRRPRTHGPRKHSSSRTPAVRASSRTTGQRCTRLPAGVRAAWTRSNGQARNGCRAKPALTPARHGGSDLKQVGPARAQTSLSRLRLRNDAHLQRLAGLAEPAAAVLARRGRY